MSIDNLLYFPTSYRPDFELSEDLDRLQGKLQYTTQEIALGSTTEYFRVARVQQLANTLRSKWRVIETVAGIKHVYAVNH